MTNLEISKALALAIGWNSEHIKVTDAVFARWDWYWRVFDYRDWNVIGPIAARYDCFPMRGLTDAFWHSCCVTGEGSVNVYTDTPQKAIAMAVIEGAKK